MKSMDVLIVEPEKSPRMAKELYIKLGFEKIWTASEALYKF